MSSMKSDLQNNRQNENIISNKDNPSNFTVKYSNDIKNHVKKQVNILDILDTMVASNVEASVAANGVRDNVIACADDGGDNLIKDDGAISQNIERSPPDGSIGTRKKRSGNDYESCCNELSVYINVVEDDTVKDIHNKWVGSYFLQSSMSNANLLVYERQTSKRYLYIRRQGTHVDLIVSFYLFFIKTFYIFVFTFSTGRSQLHTLKLGATRAACMVAMRMTPSFRHLAKLTCSTDQSQLSLIQICALFMKTLTSTPTTSGLVAEGKRIRTLLIP